MPMGHELRRRTALAGLAAPFILPGVARAAWPDRPIRLVVPFPPGSATDTLSRPFAEALSRELEQPVIIDNRAGGNGVVGTENAARSPADGNTLVIYSTSGASVNPHTLRRIPYDPIRDFAPIGFIAEMPYILVVAADHPARDMAGFVDYLRRRNGEATFSYGNSASLIAVSLLGQATGTRVQPIPYRGGPEALTDVMAGRIDGTFTDLGPGLSQVRGGRVRALGITTLNPFPLVPDVPPLSATVPGYDLTVWYGLAAPAGTPQPIVERAAVALNKAIDDPALAERFARQGFVPRHMTAERFGTFLQEQLVLWGERVRLAGIQPE
jgi:tripartite-type tricarboxylate transporter receptor subunit TctC